jgi:hypothetical protein
MDILLTLAIGAIQLALGVMGVYVSLRPPEKKHHVVWMSAFVIVGLFGIGLTHHLAKSADLAQQQNSLQQGQIATQQREIQRQLQSNLHQQEYTNGQLDAMGLMVGKILKSKNDTEIRQLASQVRKMTEATKFIPAPPTDVQVTVHDQ